MAAQRAEIDRERHHDPHHGPEGPRAAEPVMHGRVPEQRRGQEEEADDGQEQRREEAVKPMGEIPEQGDGESRGEEDEGRQKAGHGGRRSVPRAAARARIRIDRDLHAPVLPPALLGIVGGDRLGRAPARSRNAGAIDTLLDDEIRG